MSHHAQQYAKDSPGQDAGMGASDLDALLFQPEGPAPFATTESLTSCAQYLEPMLRGLGLKQWQLMNGDAVAALNCIYDLVQQHQRAQESREQVQDELHKAKVDVKVANKTVQRLHGQLDAKEQELGALNIKLRQLDAWYRDETARWTNEREELCRKSAQLEQRHVQFQHELRRRDAEFERLQKHLAKQVTATEQRRHVGSSTCSSSSTSIVLASAGSGSRSGSRGHLHSSKAGAGGGSSASQLELKRITRAELEELYKRSVEMFETEKQGLEGDNTALRKALHSLEREHMELLNRVQGGARYSGAGSSSSDCRASPNSSSSPSSDKACRPGSGSSNSSPSAARPAVPVARVAADPAAALHKMHTNLQALKVRKQRVTGAAPLSDLQQQAESASERLLLAKLQEAGRIMEEQETALALALKAISASKEQHN